MIHYLCGPYYVPPVLGPEEGACAAEVAHSNPQITWRNLCQENEWAMLSPAFPVCQSPSSKAYNWAGSRYTEVSVANGRL